MQSCWAREQGSVKVAGVAYLHGHECITREETPHPSALRSPPLPKGEGEKSKSQPTPGGEAGPQGGGGAPVLRVGLRVCSRVMQSLNPESLMLQISTAS